MHFTKYVTNNGLKNMTTAMIKDLPFLSGIRKSTHVKIAQLVNKMCSQQACSKLVNKLYNNAVILSSCYKVITHNLLTNC